MQKPKVALLDEVAAGVHPRLRQIMLDAIDSLRDAGTTFLVIEHDMELAEDICDRIIVMGMPERSWRRAASKRSRTTCM